MIRYVCDVCHVLQKQEPILLRSAGTPVYTMGDPASAKPKIHYTEGHVCKDCTSILIKVLLEKMDRSLLVQLLGMGCTSTELPENLKAAAKRYQEKQKKEAQERIEWLEMRYK